MNEFKELGLSKKIVDVLDEMKFSSPTEIQKQTIPLVMKGVDLIANAATGSGKTLAFASGIIEKTVPRKGIQALVLAPTRELAEQISKVMKGFARNFQLNIQEVYGGMPLDRQVRGIRNAEVIVGTPGRILDHLQRKNMDLSQIKILVLDEADRMADMGFIPDVEKIISQCGKKRQTLLFSATNSKDVYYLEKKFMNSPTHITVEKYLDKSHLHQNYYNTPDQLKFSVLVSLLKKEKLGVIMIFCNTRRTADMIAMNLQRYDLNAHAIHGGLDQNKRNKILDKFHRKEVDILVCTDVAARGLDIKDVSHVYNYDIPPSSEEYIHRIGRTARAGKKGIAISLVSSRDYDNFRKVISDESLNIEEKDLPYVEQLRPNFTRDKNERSRGRNDGRDNDRRGSFRSRPQRSSGRREPVRGSSRSYRRR